MAASGARPAARLRRLRRPVARRRLGAQRRRGAAAGRRSSRRSRTAGRSTVARAGPSASASGACWSRGSRGSRCPPPGARRCRRARSPATATSTSPAARRIATSCASPAASRGSAASVYLRFAHEMNGYWYPWSHGPRGYVFAWRRIVRIFDVAGARNVRFVWSVNPNLYESQRAWRRGLRRVLAGPPLRRRRRLDDDRLRRRRSPTRCAASSRGCAWLRRDVPQAGRADRGQHRLRRPRARGCGDLRAMLAASRGSRPSRGRSSRAAARSTRRGTGVVDWDVRAMRRAPPILAGIIRDGR